MKKLAIRALFPLLLIAHLGAKVVFNDLFRFDADPEIASTLVEPTAATDVQHATAPQLVNWAGFNASPVAIVDPAAYLRPEPNGWTAGGAAHQ